VKAESERLKAGGDVFHVDLHSMPSQGTALHNDPGGRRADVVISDFHGKSSRQDFVELIKAAYAGAGFSISYNWPYFGGGITQMYGRPEEKHHTVQIELNRALYMDEGTKKRSAHFQETQARLTQAIQAIRSGLEKLS
jgi:N-formylglutamate amidohydrolase